MVDSWAGSGGGLASLTHQSQTRQQGRLVGAVSSPGNQALPQEFAEAKSGHRPASRGHDQAW